MSSLATVRSSTTQKISRHRVVVGDEGLAILFEIESESGTVLGDVKAIQPRRWPPR